jgi:uncharacterized repeat protein (TIGR01451 family)
LFAAGAQAQSVDVLVNHNAIPASATGLAGGSFTYQVITQLNGAGPATNVVMTQRLPVDAIFRSIDVPAGVTCAPALSSGTVITAANQVFTCTLGTLPASGDSRVVGFNVTLPSVETNKWRAYASATSSEADSDPDNNQNIDRNITTTKAADLGIVFNGPATAPTQYSPYTYTAVVTNHGPSTIPAGGSAQVTFEVPVGATGSTPSGSGWNCTPAAANQNPGTTFTCSHPAPAEGIASGDALPELTFPAIATAAPGSSIAASVNVSGFDAGGSGTMPFPDAVTDNNTRSATISDIGANLEVDVSLEKWNSRPNPWVVDTDAPTAVEWTLSVTGSDAPQNVRVVDTLPAGVVYNGFTGSGWACSPAGQVITCDYSGSAPAVGNAYSALRLQTTVPAGGTAGATVTNTGTVSASNECTACVNAFNTDTSTVTYSDTVSMSVSKSTSLSVVQEGEMFTYGIRARNTSTLPIASTVTVVDNVPQYIRIDSISAASITEGWSCPGLPVTGAVDLTCTNAAGFAPNGYKDLTLNATVMPLPAGYSTAIINRVGITGVGDRYFPIQPSNSVSVAASPELGDLGITKSASKVRVDDFGEEVTYTLTVTNAPGAGFQRSTGITVKDSLTNLITSTHGLARNADGTHAAGATAPFPNGGFVSASVSINGGPTQGSACTNGTALGAGNGSIGGDATNTTREWSCEGMELEPGASATITLVVRHFAPDRSPQAPTPTNPANYYRQGNIATVSSTQVRDTNDGNDRATTEILVRPVVDLAAHKTPTPSPAKAGEPITYTVVVQNLGPSVAHDVTMVDTLPANGYWIGGSLNVANGGTCTTQPANGALGGTLECSWPTLASGAQYAVTYRQRSSGDVGGQTPPAVLRNTVHVDTSTHEEEKDNNDAEAVVPLDRTELNVLINMSHSADAIALGDETEYTITVTNNGPAFATEVVMTDVFPGVLNPKVPGSPASSATFSWQAGTLAVTSSNGSTTLVPVATACPDLAAGATSGPLVCNLGTMAPNEVVTIKFKMTAQSLPAGRLTGTVFHNATVSAKEEGLTDPALDVLADNDTNDRTSTRDPSVPPGSIEDVDLSLDKDGTSSALVGPSDRLKAGDTVVYTLTVKNEETEVGRNSTLGVVTDVLPTGVTLVSAPGCTHDTATRTLTCPVGAPGRLRPAPHAAATRPPHVSAATR